MRTWHRGPGSDIEAQLRASRPEPSPELTRSIADRVRPRRSVMRGLARVPLGLAGGLTAIIVTVALALGAGSATVDTATDSANVRHNSTQIAQAPAINQYEEEVTVCILGFVTWQVDPDIAATLVGFGVARYGPCGGGGFGF